MIKKSTFIVSYVLIIIIITVSFGLFIYYDIFKKTQENFQNSITSGYGFYGDPVESPCLTSDGRCNTAGTKTITKNCIVHPVTKKGCLLSNGTMSYDNLVETVPCKKQCVASSFTYSKGLEVKEFTDNNNVPFTIPVNSGGAYLVDNYGIDVSETFLDSFDILNNTHNIKRCLNNNEYFSYSVHYRECNHGDDKEAGNKCLFSCGIDDPGVLRTPLVTDTDLGIKTYNYPKVNGRYRCLDLYANNQLEVFNTGTVPADFNYPSQCYDHFTKIGSSITLNVDGNIVRTQNYFSLENLNLSDYKLIYDYNFYSPLEIGNDSTIIEEINNTNQVIYQDINNPGWLYLDMEKDYSGDNRINIGTKVIDKDIDFFNLQDNNILALDLRLFTGSGDGINSGYFYGTSHAFFNYSGTAPSVGDFVYYRINNQNVDKQSQISKISLVESDYFGIKINDLGEDAYRYNIQYWVLNSDFAEQIELYGNSGNNGVSAGNRIENNKYFLSDILLPRNGFIGSSVTALDIYNAYYFRTNPTDIFYIYSESRKAFYYPVTLSNTLDSSYNFKLEEYGDTVFYLLDGGVSNTIYPPNKDLDHNSFRDLLGYCQAVPILNSYGSLYVDYIKGLKILSDGLNTNINFGDYDYNIYIGDFKNWYRLLNVEDKDLVSTTIKKLDSLASDIEEKTSLDFNPFVEKMKIYNDLTVGKIYNAYNTFGSSLTLTIYPSKAIVEIANFDTFKTPNIVDSQTGSLISKNVCFDNFGKPLPVGTQIQLHPGEKISYYVNKELNAEDYVCGFYGLSGANRATINRASLFPVLGTSTLVPKDKNAYYNYLDFLEGGYNLEDLYCYKGTNNTEVEADIKNCREPFTTRLYTGDYYNNDENLIDYFNDNALYYSSIDNNINDPKSAKDWVKVLDYNNREYVIEDNNVYDLYNDYYFIYNTTTRGVTGESLARVGVYYLYKKKDPIYELRNYEDYFNSYLYDYILSADYYQNNWYDETLNTNPGSIRFQDNFVNDNNSDNYLYDIDLSVSASLGSSLYSYKITIDSGEEFSTGDFFNPDFNLFNSVLLTDGISVFSFNSNSGNDDLTGGCSIITNTTNNSNLKKEALVFIAYSQSYDLVNNFKGDVNLFNYAFEVCKVLDFDTTSVILERNLLNYPLVSNFSGNNVDYTAYLLDDNFDTKLLYQIIDIEGTKISFNFNAYSYNTPNINNILANPQSRTAFSARIIKNNFSLPNAPLPDDSSNLYLKESPNKNLLNAYLDLIVKVERSDGLYDYYFNQYREDNYSNNNKETFFNIGDVVTLSDNTNSYDLAILDTKKSYQNSLYDYYATSSLDISVKKLNYLNAVGDYFFIFDPLSETINQIHPDKIKTESGIISPENYTIELYQKWLEAGLNITFYGVEQFVSDQFTIDKDSIPTYLISLKSTRIYPDLTDLNAYLTIDNIEINAKPYGASYLTNLAKSNVLDLDGYGTIINFTISEVLNFSPSATQLLSTLSGIKFGFSNNVPSFNFKTLERVQRETLSRLNKVYAIKTPSNYRDITYSKDNLVFYNTVDPFYYQNVNPRVSLFDPSKTNYSQPFYILENGIYNYPLYLEKKTGRNSFAVPGAPGISLYYDSDDFSPTSTKPNLNIYQEFILGESLKLDANWKQVKNSIYPVDTLNDYSDNNYYGDGDLVIYQNNVYSSTGDNYGTKPFFGISTNWILNSYNPLGNLNHYYYNKNIGLSTQVIGLSTISKFDTINYPLGIVDYGTSTNYTLRLGTKGVLSYSDKFSNSFLSLDIFSKQLEILGKALIFNKEGNIITLASSPITSGDIDNYGFLKAYPQFRTNTKLSQYIYDIKLPPQSFSGKAFCTGDVLFSGVDVSNYTYANSVTFLPVPVDLEYQDYPKINFISGVSTYKNPPLAIPKKINKVIRESGTNYSLVEIGISSSYYTKVNNTDITSGVAGKLVPGSDPPQFTDVFNYTFNGTSKNYYINNADSYLDFGTQINLYDNAPWYVQDKNSVNVASGYFRLENINQNTGGVSPLNNLFIASLNNDILENNPELTFYRDNTVKVENVEIISLPNMLQITQGTTFAEGEYYFYGNLQNINDIQAGVTEKFRAYLSFDSNNKLLNFDQYYLKNTSFNTDDKLYFLPQNGTSSLKIKMYGFFGSEFLSPINYSGDKTVTSTSGEIPNLIFSPFSNNLLEPYNNDLSLVDSDGTKAIISNLEQDSYSNVFNLTSDGTSLTLTTNFFKYPIFDNDNIAKDNIPLTNAIGLSGNSRLGAINTNSVIDFISTPFDINTFTSLGEAEDVIPFDDTVNNLTQYYREINGNNINNNSSLDCSIYTSGLNNFYLSGAFLDTIIEEGTDGKILSVITQGVSGTQFLSSKVPIINYNSNVRINQNDPSNDNFPVYIGLSPGNQFADSVVKSQKSLNSETDIILTYLVDAVGVSSATYYNEVGSTNYNDFSTRSVNIVLTKNDFYKTISDKTIYLGYKQINGDLVQFSGGMSSLTFTDYS